MRTIGLVTSARSDLSFYLPLMRRIALDPSLKLEVIATGMHLSRRHGLTVREVARAGFHVAHRIPTLGASDHPSAIAAAMGAGVTGFSRLFARRAPDLLVVMGDRFDMFPAALAALPFRIPVAHISGGDVTEGAIDDSLRHGLTKLSHLHFASTALSAARLLRMGEERWRVSVTGSLAVDNIKNTPAWTLERTAARFGFDPKRPFALATFHPATLEHERSGRQADALLRALRAAPLQCVFTKANADTGGAGINARVAAFCRRRRGAVLVANAGAEGYLSLMRWATVMLGNSSSGLVEAPSFRLPVVNVGTRQAGRQRAANVIDVAAGSAPEIARALRKALSAGFRARLRGLRNPYGDGRTAERIAEILASVELSDRLLRKKFNFTEGR